ncbi:MAG TPA: integrase core domain-containing protein [Chitinophagaceae bacterium]|nr:integrase core domain-containing protein [Chitinophagaceae bacterium]
MKNPLKGDNTLYRERINRYSEFVNEYEAIKNNKHPEFSYVQDWANARKICKKNFLKYYGRYRQSGCIWDLAPKKRGPRYKTRRTLQALEQKVIDLRKLGNNKYEIAAILKDETGSNFTLSPSGVYNICKRYGLNRLRPQMKHEKRRIIKERMGQLGHIDTHYLSKHTIKGSTQKLFIVAILDDYSRVAWAEIIESIDSLSVMFGAMRCLNVLKAHYHIQFEEIISDNGNEFGNRNYQSKMSHPFERLLIEMGVKHRYTQPYRPQTNGKIERFWRTLQEDLIIDTDFDSPGELKEELLQYMYYYNHERPNQAIEGKKPVEMLELKQD